MRKLMLLAALVAALSGARAARAEVNPLFGYTHLLPSPLTLPAGKLVLGTGVAYGVLDSVQVGTDLWRDIYQIYNANVKVNVLSTADFALAGYVSYEHFNYNTISSANPDLTVSSWQPGLVLGYQLAPGLAHFIGGNLNYTQTSLISEGVSTAGYLQGAVLESDLSWAYLEDEKGIGPVLSGGVSYDFSYKLLGVGVSHTWRGFKVGVHYYPKATQYKIQPILLGGVAVDF